MFYYLKMLTGRLLFVFTRPILGLIVKDTERSRVMILKDRQLLLTQDILGNGYWTLPGGGLEKNETMRNCVIREINEELSFMMSEDRLHFVKRHTVSPRMGTRYFAHVFVYYFNHEVITIKQSEILAAKWFSIDNLPVKRTKLIDDILAERDLNSLSLMA